MTILDGEHLFETRLPQSWAPVLQRLAQLALLRNGPKESKPERSLQARALYQELLELTSLIQEPTPAEHRHDAPGFKRWFGEAVLLWMELGRSNSAPSIDTLGVGELQNFPHDFPSDEPACVAMKAALCQAFDWSPAEFVELDRWFQHVTANLELKRRISTALADFLRQGQRLEASGRVEFMRAFYQDAPFLAGEVDLMISSTAVVFFVPRRGKKLFGEAWERRSQAERDAVTAFLSKLDQGNVAETTRFPSFGYGQSTELAEELLGELSRVLQLPDAVLRDTLKTMFSLIPKELAAQYLVHDMWGHVWQETLSDFEYEYALLSSLEEELTPSCGQKYGEPGAGALLGAFAVKGGVTQLDPEVWRRLLRADLVGRLRVGASFAFSEVLADFMESKYSRALPARELPTSSLIPSTSLKLDLTLSDLGRQIKRASSPYRIFVESREARERFLAELLSAGMPRAGAELAIEQARSIVMTEVLPLAELELEPIASVSEVGQLKSSFYRRYLLQNLLVMAELERALSWTKVDDSTWRNPGQCPDFLCIAFTHFYEQDRAANIWYLDQVARNEFQPACERLRSALATGQSSASSRPSIDN